MYQEERLLKILEYLNEHNTMSIHDICEMFNVSRDTARRDILKLIDNRTAIRTHGGISLPILKNTIKEYRERIEAYSEEKRNIAKRALDFIEEDKHYFFDVSTIINFLSKEINKPIWVLTHSLDNIEVLSEKKDISVNSIGGRLNSKNRFFYKADWINYIDGLRFDIAFLGAASITQDGIYYVDEEDAVIKQAAVKKADTVIVLAEYEKFKHLSYYKGVNWDQIDIIITDKMPPSAFVKIIEEYGTQLIIV
ncbi:DeoR/GlpR family DNA-binding transcription regulator [Clostridium folliculivorans]|uniref:HTH-type transcriptional repressor GlcR n=1 Tax=Clostridium folliculivorans TaxID=2886038 RepID=A0A9W5XZV6_9CLOT|nr:DeoR/GlpR family DNA-binding transcription regulator [Clostridium folliculivorans]GKU24144.1 HTH-type transcriptional repressor GlcR [Clostridium folliculivorans]GKU30250.1 HTH-type transcriptional repressor GlcR [Clostridium folliculivorans]